MRIDVYCWKMLIWDEMQSIEEQKHFIHYDANQRNQYYELYSNVLNELDTTCTMTFDLRNGFDSYSETIFYDQGHVGDKGNQIIAKQIYTKVLPIIKNDIQSLNIDLH